MDQDLKESHSPKPCPKCKAEQVLVTEGIRFTVYYRSGGQLQRLQIKYDCRRCGFHWHVFRRSYEDEQVSN